MRTKLGAGTFAQDQQETGPVLASYSGTVNESVVRNLAELSSRGVIRAEGKDLYIVDRGALEKICKG